MERGLQGRFVLSDSGPEHCRAFVPEPLPPSIPLRWDQDLYEHALTALGRLDGISHILPDSELFLYLYVRKEAVLSSQIEGTQSSLADLLAYEAHDAPGVPPDDVEEVSNYVRAIEHGMHLIREGGLPVCSRVIREAHAALLRSGRGSARDPGRFRTTQNWVGGARPQDAVFVLPPANYIEDCIADLERFINDQPFRTPTLVKAALAHVRFETIHPFLDGNGRVGRLLITLILCYEKALMKPVLYLSLFFKTRRAEYYDLLQTVRFRGDWEAWLNFFFEGVRSVSEQAFETAMKIESLFAHDKERIERSGEAVGTTLRVHELLRHKVRCTAPTAVRALGLSQPTINKAFERLRRLGIVREITGRERDRVFVYGDYLDILEEGTTPLP